MDIGNRIKQRRLELELTADELADKVGKSRATIYRYENGYIENLPTTVLEPLAEALLTTPAYLMGWVDDPNDYEAIGNEEGIYPPKDYEGTYEDFVKYKINEKPEEGYYLNDETREIAQEIFEKPEMKALFDMSQKIPPERLRAHLEYLEKLFNSDSTGK